MEKAEGYKVKEVKSLKGDFIGMNPHAAKQLGMKYRNGKTVQVLSKLPKKEKKLTVQHEIDEDRLIKQHRLPYKEAHVKATRLENLGLHRRIGTSNVGHEVILMKRKKIRG